MIKCSECQFENKGSAVICAQCGEMLPTRPDLMKIPNTSALMDDRTTTVIDYGRPGTSTFTSDMELLLKFENETLAVPVTSTLFLGRDTTKIGITSSIDLTPYGAYTMGVSRLHAEIRISPDHFLEIMDLHSTNGTYLNNKSLKPLYSYRLHDGDQVRIASLTMTIHYKDSKEAALDQIIHEEV
jgi:hypothetical protein